MNWQRLQEALIRDEGKRRKLYKDTEGIATIGIGRNLESVGLSDQEIMYLFGNDLRAAYLTAKKVVDSFPFLGDERQEVLVNMAFNLGATRLKTFKLMIAAINRGDFHEAAKQMRESKWYAQVGDRAQRLALQMETGQIPGEA